MSKGFLTFSSAIILQAVANEYRHGFDIIDVTGLPGGTVYPALRRLERDGLVESHWEDESIGAGQRPPRKYYRVTKDGGMALEASVRRYPLLAKLNALE